MASKQPFARRILIAFVLMTTLVSGLFSLSIVAVVHFIEEHLVSQELSEFALHARAILGLPIPVIRQSGPSASCAMLAHGHGVPVFGNVEGALEEPDTALRLFGKPRVEGHRRVGVTLARGEDVDIARSKARAAAAAITIELK